MLLTNSRPLRRPRPRILLDVDGPLTDGFFAVACEYLRAEGFDAWPRLITDWDVFKSFDVPADVEKRVRALLRAPGVAAAFAPRPGADEFVNALREWTDVYAVTAPLDGSATWGHEREVWLAEHLGFDLRHVSSTRDKTIIAGSALVDDKAGTIRAWQDEHPRGLAVLWREAHNETDRWHAVASDYAGLTGWLEALRVDARVEEVR